MVLSFKKNHIELMCDNGATLKLVPSFEKDLKSFAFMDGVDVSNVFKKQSKKTYKNKDGKDKHFYNYYVQLPNRKCIQVKCLNNDDYNVLDFIAQYIKVDNKHE